MTSLGFETFHEAVKRVKPTETVKPDTYWVGILPADKLPSEVKAHTDILWIKARAKTVLGRIKQAFCFAKTLNKEDVLMKFGTASLEDDVCLGDLDHFKDKLVAIEAVKKAERSSRFSQGLENIHQEEAISRPLHDVSNHLPATPTDTIKPRTGPLSSSLGPHSLPLTPAGASPLISTDSLSSPRSGISEISRLGGISKSRSPAPSSSLHSTSFFHPDMEDTTLMAFMDFNCERREIRKRYDAKKPLGQLGTEIALEWVQLPEPARKHFMTRACSITSKAIRVPGIPPGSLLVFSFAGFWTYYYARIEMEHRKGFFPHKEMATQTQFFNRIMSDWDVASPSMRLEYMRPHLDDVRQYPIKLPTLTPAVTKCEPAPKIEQTDNNASMTAVPAEEGSTGPQTKAPPMFNIQELFTDCTAEQLEDGVKGGVELLEKIRNTLSSQGQNPEVAQWLQNIQNVAKQAEQSKTIVGVVGNTGAGKSSVINALLDEERLLPTNCMRACTAVVTEISYNHEETPYCAQIEFISAKSWQDELKVLFQDLLDGNGAVSSECYNADSEAGIAYAKIKAVYPKLTKEEIANSSVETLMAHDNVSRLLGTSKSFSSSDSLRFYKDLQRYVDSKEKSTEAKGKDKEKKPREMEYWPLIRVVRLQVRAEALRSGVVLCDLPGVHDSNQARAAVAENYMKQCTGLWIVAPITRAVDDKAAKSLLGESFKRQLKMDGGFSTVTFICSKTDDISIVEAQDSLGIEEEMGALWQQAEKLEQAQKRLQKEIEELKDAKGDYNAALENADEELDVWDKLLDDFTDGQTVYAPTPKVGNKRKRGSSSADARKRQRHSGDDSDADFNDDTESGQASETEESDNEECGEPLTSDQIQTRIAELRAVKKDGRREKAKLEESIKEIRSNLAEIQKEKDKVDAEMNTICISGRNQYSKGAIQQDFAAGIKELDQELAEEQDAANFNPDIDQRDYEEVARSLPVFCVSSRAYQKLQGRFKQDATIPGFKHADETEIPQLQAHCKKLTEAGRETTSRRFLNSLNQLLNSLRLWSSSDGAGRNLSAGQRARESQILEGFFKKLDEDIEKAVKSVCNMVNDELQDQVYDQFMSAIDKAIEAAIPTVQHWGAPVNRSDRSAGGLYWATYKAICRRNGVYSNAQGLHDFNAQLTDPMLKVFAPGWERCFSRRVPGIMAGLSTTVGIVLEKFHSLVEDRARRNGGPIASLQMLKQQLNTYKETFKDIATTARDEIITNQKDINREFVPVVAEAMERAYSGCSAEYGPGSFMRMKGLMSEHVDYEKAQMFRKSTESVRGKLSKMVRVVEDNMLTKADVVFLAVKRDYSAAVVGQNAVNVADVPRGERLMRSEVLDIVESADNVFKRGLGLPVEEEDTGNEDPDSQHSDQESLSTRSSHASPAKSASDKQNNSGTLVKAEEDTEMSDTSSPPRFSQTASEDYDDDPLANEETSDVSTQSPSTTDEGSNLDTTTFKIHEDHSTNPTAQGPDTTSSPPPAAAIGQLMEVDTNTANPPDTVAEPQQANVEDIKRANRAGSTTGSSWLRFGGLLAR